jgi:hypothetical protein
VKCHSRMPAAEGFSASPHEAPRRSHDRAPYVTFSEDA